MLLRLHVNALDIAILAVYFAVVLGIGVLARRSIATSEDFLLSGRSLPAWITGLAFVSANLGATEILGMAANGAQYGVSTVQFYWIGAVPAMVFLGLVMMPFYYGAKVRSVPEYLRLRFNDATHQLNAWTFAIASVLIAGVNLYALALVVNALLGWPKWLAILVAAAFVLAYIFLGGLSGRDLQRGAAVLRHPGGADPARRRRAAQGRRHQRPRPQGHAKAPWVRRATTPGAASGWAIPTNPLGRLDRHRLRARASCCRSATGRPTSPRCSARSPPRTCSLPDAPR